MQQHFQCLLAHGKLGVCRASLVSLERSALSIPTRSVDSALLFHIIIVRMQHAWQCRGSTRRYCLGTVAKLQGVSALIVCRINAFAVFVLT